jgi:hypothetical protein
MIVQSKTGRYDGSWRIPTYDTGPDGTCRPELRKSDMDSEIEVYYQQREKEFARLHGRLFAGELSPVGFYLELQRLSPEEVAARMKLRASVVRRHATPAGFVAVADFFHFVEPSGELAIDVRQGQAGLVHHVRVALEGREPSP